MFATFTQLSVFQRASDLLLQHSNSSEILRCSRWCNREIHVCTQLSRTPGWLPSPAHYTVNALSAGKLAPFSTSNVFFTLSCTRQLTPFTCICLPFIWTVYLIWLFVCFLCGYRRGFCRGSPPPSRVCLDSDGGIVYLVIYAVSLSLSAFPLSISIQRWELCVVSTNSKHTSSLTLNTLLNSCLTEVHTRWYALRVLKCSFCFPSSLHELRLSSVHRVFSQWKRCFQRKLPGPL